MEVELQDRNPAVLVNRRRRGNAGPREQREYTTWTPDEIARAVQVARGQLVYLPLMLAGWCGLRRGEVCGLRWTDVDLEAGAVSVSRSMEQAGSVLHVAPPKTASGLRSVPMPDALVDALEAHEALFRGLRARHGTTWNREGYIMATGRGTPVKPSNLSSAWADFCKRKALGHLRFHDLRHSCATDMILRQHIDVNTVSKFLGHADPAITIALYVHPDEKMRELAGAKQNKRVTAALAKAQQDSLLIRDNVVPLLRAVG
jgi:integrase